MLAVEGRPIREAEAEVLRRRLFDSPRTIRRGLFRRIRPVLDALAWDRAAALDLAHGFVEVLHFTACDAIEIDGAGYVLEVGEGQLLVVRGERLDAAREAGFPNTRFNLVRGAISKMMLDLDPKADRLLPARLVRPTLANWERCCPDHLLVPGRLETMERDLVNIVFRCKSWLSWYHETRLLGKL